MSGIEQFSDIYKIQEKIGEGSGGVVYKAFHKRLETEVIIKQMKRGQVALQIGRKEVDMLKNLQHTHLPQVIDFLEVDGEVYTVMRYIMGESLKQMLDRNYAFSQEELIKWGIQLSSALRYLHAQTPPIIHGDIKPANIMHTSDGGICLIDFNISFFLEEDMVLGYTEGYTAPEQYIVANRGTANISQQADIYSMGATFYHLATGRKIQSVKEKIDVKYLAEETSEAFASVIERATKLAPKDRYADVYELFQAFLRILEPDESGHALRKKNQKIKIGIAILTLVLVILGGYSIRALRADKMETYHSLVEQQIEHRKQKEYDKEEAVYKKASTLAPSRLEAHYQEANAIYEQKQYSQCIDFIQKTILDNHKIKRVQPGMSEVLCLSADSYFQLEEYDQSVGMYEQVPEVGVGNTAYYRDYAIALAYNGETNKAQDILEKAIASGEKEDSIYYVKGELARSMEEKQEAMVAFTECVNVTKSADLKSRAYIMMSKIEESNSNLEETRNILLEARKEIPSDKQLLILERLAQVNIDIAAQTGKYGYREDAIRVLQEIVERGWGTYETYQNLVILNQAQLKLSEAEKLLQQMEEQYGADYRTYKRYAFLEIEKQEQKNNRERDYAMFLTYYNQATELYNAQLKNNNTDTEMQLLQDVYMQIEAGGWLAIRDIEYEVGGVTYEG